MYMILWKFRPAPDRLAEFRAAYGPEGPWARLFGQAEGFIATELWRARDNDRLFLTADRWRSEQDYWRFRQLFHDQYSALDLRLQELAAEEALIGQFTLMDDDRTSAPNSQDT
jgi:heme-degrading monooxygenase HmoA